MRTKYNQRAVNRKFHIIFSGTEEEKAKLEDAELNWAIYKEAKENGIVEKVLKWDEKSQAEKDYEWVYDPQ